VAADWLNPLMCGTTTNFRSVEVAQAERASATANADIAPRHALNPGDFPCTVVFNRSSAPGNLACGPSDVCHLEVSVA
jgi:hypothetical protein